MSREVHVRFCEGLGVRLPRSTHLVVGFQRNWEAERFLGDLKTRLAKFHLELHPDKTRLIEFGRFAAENRARRGKGKPETFSFLGFTHIRGTTQAGRPTLWCHTERKRMRSKLHAVKADLRRRMHQPIPVVGRWLASILRGHYNYYGVTYNSRALGAFRYFVGRLWYWALRRRSQRKTLNWARMARLVEKWLPPARVVRTVFSQMQLPL